MSLDGWGGAVLSLECSLEEGLAVGGKGMQIGRRLFAHVLIEAVKLHREIKESKRNRG